MYKIIIAHTFKVSAITGIIKLKINYAVAKTTAFPAAFTVPYKCFEKRQKILSPGSMVALPISVASVVVLASSRKL